MLSTNSNYQKVNLTIMIQKLISGLGGKTEALLSSNKTEKDIDLSKKTKKDKQIKSHRNCLAWKDIDL